MRVVVVFADMRKPTDDWRKDWQIGSGSWDARIFATDATKQDRFPLGGFGAFLTASKMLNCKAKRKDGLGGCRVQIHGIGG